MANIFKDVAMKKPRYNTFNLNHERKMSFNIGQLIPFLVIDTLPGDRYTLQSSQILRFAPMVFPVMHRINVYTHYFFVPNRILWGNWGDFITGGEDGTKFPTFPTFQDQLGNVSTLMDYLGLPQQQGTTSNITLSVLPLAAYQAIWNEYYRDQNLQAEINYVVQDGDNPIGAGLGTLRNRAWQHDYFTSALPWTQKGPEATIPLGQYADVEFYGGAEGNPLNAVTLYKDAVSSQPIGDYPTASNNAALRASDGTANFGSKGQIINSNGVPDNPDRFGVIDNSQSLRTNLSQATAATINDLRKAFRLQEWLEKNARGGSRYTESILVHFGVKSSDARLNRPEYLGGGSSPVQFSEVLQTSPTASDLFPTPQGNMAGHGINAGSNSPVKYFCEEHGYIIGIMSVMPVTEYFQGIPKHFRKFDKFDYGWPTFANLGEQEIQGLEIYANTDQGYFTSTFGYTPRYAEYKFINSSVHGEFRTNLDKWHMARKFSNAPQLNDEFIQCEAKETDRIFAVASDVAQTMYCHIYNKVKAKRALPVFGTPTI